MDGKATENVLRVGTVDVGELFDLIENCESVDSRPVPLGATGPFGVWDCSLPHCSLGARMSTQNGLVRYGIPSCCTSGETIEIHEWLSAVLQKYRSTALAAGEGEKVGHPGSTCKCQTWRYRVLYDRLRLYQTLQHEKRTQHIVMRSKHLTGPGKPRQRFGDGVYKTRHAYWVHLAFQND